MSKANEENKLVEVKVENPSAKDMIAPPDAPKGIEIKQPNYNVPVYKPTTLNEAVVAVVGKSLEKASLLEITQKENEVLGKPFTDDDYSILPTGEVYLTHIKARKRLTEAFGRGGWALNVLDIKFDKERNVILTDVVLLVKGCFVARATGGKEYYDNGRQTYDDTIESAISNALNRLCGKSSLGIGAECWDKQFDEAWKTRNAVSVWHQDRTGRTKPIWFKKADKCPQCYKPFEHHQKDSQAKEPIPVNLNGGIVVPSLRKQLGDFFMKQADGDKNKAAILLGETTLGILGKRIESINSLSEEQAKKMLEGIQKR